MTLARLATALLALAAFGAPPVAGQAPADRVRTVGFIVLTNTPEAQLARREHPMLRPFVEAMRGHGWVEGRNIRYEVRGNGEDEARRTALLDDLLGKPLDAIVAPAFTATDVLARTRTLPVVSMGFDPSLVASLARPGGNLTGVLRSADDREERDSRGKLLGLLKQISGARHAALVQVVAPGEKVLPTGVGPVHRAMAAQLGMTLEVLPVRDLAQLDRAFVDARRRGMDSLVLDNGLGWPPGLAERLSQLIRRHRVPAISAPLVSDTFKDSVVASFGLDTGVLPTRAAYLVDRILRGARPGDLPVERPQANSLVLYLANAEAIGLAVPDAVRVQAARIVR